MNQEQTGPLAAHIRGLILTTFDVSEPDAEKHAIGLAALAEGWGGSAAEDRDWPYTIRKRFGHSLRWRSEMDRQQFESRRALIEASYESYIQQQKQR